MHPCGFLFTIIICYVQLLEYTVGENAQSLTKATTIAAKRLGGITDVTKITSEDMLRMLWLVRASASFFRSFLLC